MIPPPPRSTLFPYTTLFRSIMDPSQQPFVDGGEYEASPHDHTLPSSWLCHPRHADSTTDRKSTRLNSSHVAISYAVFCLKKKTTKLTSRIKYRTNIRTYPYS